jgi:hypothetical protein
MPIEFKLKPQAQLLFAISTAFPLGAYAAGAATVDFASGNVSAVQADGRARTLTKGGEVNTGEMIDTGNGRAQLRFSDGALVSLSPQTQFRIDEYQFKGHADGSEKGFFSLLKGALRTITGSIGRSNRNNYKLGTTVATIGIRGTEFSVVYGNSITVTTGGGSVDVCNTGGCLIVDTGLSAYVKDIDTKPTFTQKPAQPSLQQGPLGPEIFIAGDQRTPDGMVLLGPPLPSGSPYALAYADPVTNVIGVTPSASAVFDESGQLTSYNSGEYVAGTIAGAFSDGIIGWGRWATGTYSSGSSTWALSNYHYVVGAPTPASDPVWTSGVTNASYALMGFTYPTRADGVVGTLPVTATLTVNFAAPTSSTMGLTVPFAGTTHIFTGTVSGAFSAVNPTFSGSLSGGSGGSFAGLFAGANASRAGISYKFDSGAGDVFGALAFRRK